MDQIIHIGELIRQELTHKDVSATWLADKLHCSRTNIYKIFKRDSIDTQLLMQISSALQSNLFRFYTDQLQSINNKDK